MIPEGAPLRGMTCPEIHTGSTFSTESWQAGAAACIDLDAPRAVYLPGWYRQATKTQAERAQRSWHRRRPVDQLPFGAVFQITEIAMSYDPGAGKWYAWYRISYPGSAEQSWVRGDYVIIDW